VTVGSRAEEMYSSRGELQLLRRLRWPSLGNGKTPRRASSSAVHGWSTAPRPRPKADGLEREEDVDTSKIRGLTCPLRSAVIWGAVRTVRCWVLLRSVRAQWFSDDSEKFLV